MGGEYFSQLILTADRSLRLREMFGIFAARTRNSRNLARIGAPGRTRTCDPRLRSPMFYPTEQRAHRLRLSLSPTMFTYLLGRTAGIIVASGGVAQAATTTDICPWALRVRVTRISTL